MNIYLAWTIAILYWICYPIYWLGFHLTRFLLSYVLSPLYSVLVILLQPLLYVALFLGHCLIWPVLFLKRFETMYIYLGAGGVVGMLCGAILYFSHDMLSGKLRIEPREEVTPAVKGRTAKEYRKTWNETHLRTVNGPVLVPPKIFLQDSPSKSIDRNGLVSRTIIHEEVDSDF